MLQCRMGTLQYVYLLSLTYQGCNLFAKSKFKIFHQLSNTNERTTKCYLSFEIHNTLKDHWYEYILHNTSFGVKITLEMAIMKSILNRDLFLDCCYCAVQLNFEEILIITLSLIQPRQCFHKSALFYKFII